MCVADAEAAAAVLAAVPALAPVEVARADVVFAEELAAVAARPEPGCVEMVKPVETAPPTLVTAMLTEVAVTETRAPTLPPTPFAIKLEAPLGGAGKLKLLLNVEELIKFALQAGAVMEVAVVF